MIERRFTGFKPETLQFLSDLANHNNKAWFEARRQDYEAFVLKPLRDLVSDVGPFMLSIDEQFEITPAVNKTISRIYRDTRFSRDKSPFRSNMWLVFKRPGRDWKDAPGYFFEIFPDWYRYGMGYYCASPASMGRFRNAIDANPYEFLRVTSFYRERNHFRLHGDEYKKTFDADKQDAIQAWYQKKNFYLSHDSRVKHNLFKSSLVETLMTEFSETKDFYLFLRRIHSGA